MKKKPVSLFEMFKNENIKNIWPLNLFHDIQGPGRDIYLFDPQALYDVVLLDLTKRESDIIFKYYRDGMTYDRIAEKYGKSRERIRQVKEKAIRKLRHHSRADKFFLCSYECAKKLRDEAIKTEASKSEKTKTLMTIDLLPDLYVRSYNQLKRYARNKLDQDNLHINQLTEMTLEEVMSIRNIGKGSVKNILLALKNYGNLQLKDCSYDEYAIEEEIDESRKIL